LNGHDGPEMAELLDLRTKAQKLKPTVFVGKEGVTSRVVWELSKQLDKNRLVKAKLLHSVEGATTATSANPRNAAYKARRPGASLPSSLVITHRIGPTRRLLGSPAGSPHRVLIALWVAVVQLPRCDLPKRRVNRIFP